MNTNHTPQDGFPYYFNLAKDGDCLTLFSSQSNFTFLNSIPEKKSTYRYAPDKWSIAQVIGHVTDHERIKMSRAFLLSRKDAVELWGYDQILLVDNSRSEELPLKQLVTDFQNVRRASLSFIEALSCEQLQVTGMAGQYEVTLEDFLKSIIGHERHHINIMKERYGVPSL